MTAVLVSLVVLLVLALAVAAASIRVLREYERAVVFRLGRLIGAKGPGVVLLVPLIDRMVRVSLRTHTLNIPAQDVITCDNVPARVDAVDVLPRGRPALLGRGDRELPPGHVDGRPDDAAGGARQGRPRRAAVPARAAQRAPAADHRRADRAVGDQGHDRRDPRRRHPGGDAARDGQAGRGRARAAREGHQGRGGGAGGDAAGRGGRRDQPQPGDPAAALPADAVGDRGRAELHGGVPAPDGPGQAVPGRRRATARGQLRAGSPSGTRRCSLRASTSARRSERRACTRVRARSWTFSNTRASSSSPATACPCPSGVARHHRRGGRRGRRRDRLPLRRQGPGADRRPRQGRRHQGRQRPRRGRAALEGDPRHGHPRADRPRGVDRGRVGHRRRVLRVDRLRPRGQAPAGDALHPGRHGHRGGGRQQPRRDRPPARGPAARLPGLPRAPARLRGRRRRRRRAPDRRAADQALRRVRGRGGDARRGQPADRHRRPPGRWRSTRRSRSTTRRCSATPTTPGCAPPRARTRRSAWRASAG